MSKEIVLRSFRSSDLDAMYAMDVVCFAEPFRFTRAAMEKFATARGSVTVLAERSANGASSEGALVGFAIVHLVRRLGGRRGYLVTLDVDPAHRRAGVGAALMDHAETLAASEGATAMDLHVFTGNEAALRFYEARGYRRSGEQVGFYGEKNGLPLNAWLYRKILPAPKT